MASHVPSAGLAKDSAQPSSRCDNAKQDVGGLIEPRTAMKGHKRSRSATPDARAPQRDTGITDLSPSSNTPKKKKKQELSSAKKSEEEYQNRLVVE